MASHHMIQTRGHTGSTYWVHYTLDEADMAYLDHIFTGKKGWAKLGYVVSPEWYAEDVGEGWDDTIRRARP